MKFLKILRILVIVFFVWSIGGVLLHRFVPVPITPVMIRYCFSELYDGKTPNLAHKWVPIEEISPHLKKAVIASEDQLFYEHNGFDFGEGLQIIGTFDQDAFPAGSADSSKET